MQIFLIFILAAAIPLGVFAQDYSDPISEGEVIVEKRTDLTLNYKERRSQFGILFSANYEKFSPDNYQSLILNQNFLDATGGDSIPVMGAEFGVKWNMDLGSVAALVGYGAGTYSNADQGIDEIKIKITKASLNLTLDNLMSEPIVAPYGQIGINSIDWSEASRDSTNEAKEETFTTDWNFNYKVGILFQLDWIERSIDPNTHTNGLRSSGLQNTYLDIFYSSYAAPSEVASVDGATGEADLESNNFGVGLKLEF
jgi:hypothetical protein